MPFAIIGSIILALSLFSAALLLGVWLVKRLKLPQDLPDEILFDAPPPPVLTAADPEAAKAAAASQAERVAPYQRARAIYRQAEAIHLAAQAWEGLDGEGAQGQQQNCRQAIDSIEQAVDALLDALKSRDGATVQQACDDHGPAIERAHQRCAAAIEHHPPADHRRLWLMLGLLVLVVLFQVVMTMILRA